MVKLRRIKESYQAIETIVNLLHIIFFPFFLSFCVAARGLSLVGVSGPTLRCGARASHCGGFSCCRARAVGARASVIVACGL